MGVMLCNSVSIACGMHGGGGGGGLGDEFRARCCHTLLYENGNGLASGSPSSHLQVSGFPSMPD